MTKGKYVVSRLLRAPVADQTLAQLSDLLGHDCQCR